MTSLTDAKKRLYVINNGFNYHLIVLSTSPLLFLFIFFILIFQINYCCGDFPFFCFQNADRFSNKDNEVQWTACVSQYVRETGRLKDPGGTPCTGLYEDSCGEPPPEKGNLFREK